MVRAVPQRRRPRHHPHPGGFDDAAAGEAHFNSDHFQEFLATNDTKPFVAEVPDIIYVDVPDREGWDKMAEF